MGRSHSTLYRQKPEVLCTTEVLCTAGRAALLCDRSGCRDRIVIEVSGRRSFLNLLPCPAKPFSVLSVVGIGEGGTEANATRRGRRGYFARRADVASVATSCDPPGWRGHAPTWRRGLEEGSEIGEEGGLEAPRAEGGAGTSRTGPMWHRSQQVVTLPGGGGTLLCDGETRGRGGNRRGGGLRRRAAGA